MFGWVRKIPKVFKKVLNIVNDPRVDMGLSVAALVVPGGQLLQIRKVLDRVKVAEALYGPESGLSKFNEVFDSLIKDPDIRDNKELKDLIEKAVMIVNGTVIALDLQGNKID